MRGVSTSAGPPTRVATTGRPRASASSIAWPCGSSRLGRHTTSALAISAATPSESSRPAKRVPTGAVARSRSSSGPPPTIVSVPPPSLPNASSSRSRFLRRVSEPMNRKRGPLPFVSRARGTGFSRSVSTPQSITSTVTSWGAASSLATYAETQITAAARRSTGFVSAATTGLRRMLRTSEPCAVITYGTPVAIATRPVGTRKWA